MIVDTSDTTGDASGTSKRQLVVDFLKHDLRSITGTTDTLVITDANAFIKCNNTGGALTITVPLNSSVAFEIGTKISFWRNHTNTVTFSPASGSVVIASRGGSLTTSVRYSVVHLLKVQANGWLLYGDLG
tara:strand:- start:1379 stop:1768 length:390 start_codon:yes stop_codon:yes gene_type:complete